MNKKTKNVLIFLGAGFFVLVLLVLAFFGGLFSVFSGDINGLIYSGAYISMPNRVFEDETVSATFTANSISQSDFIKNNSSNIAGNNTVFNGELYGNVFAWFLDGELIQTFPVDQTKSIQIDGKGTAFRSWGSLNVIDVPDGDRATMALIASDLINSSAVINLSAKTLGTGKHRIEFKSYLINYEACGNYSVDVGGLKYPTDFRTDDCPAYSSAPVELQYASPLKSISFNRSYEDTLSQFAPKFSTIVSKEFEILALKTPIILQEVCGNGLDDDADELIDEDCVTSPGDGGGYVPPSDDGNPTDGSGGPVVVEPPVLPSTGGGTSGINWVTIIGGIIVLLFIVGVALWVSKK